MDVGARGGKRKAADSAARHGDTKEVTRMSCKLCLEPKEFNIHI